MGTWEDGEANNGSESWVELECFHLFARGKMLWKLKFLQQKHKEEGAYPTDSHVQPVWGIYKKSQLII